MREEFIEALRSNQNLFDVGLSREATSTLADYYDLVQTQNPLLHLVAPGSPANFAVRHILESLTLLEFLPKKTIFTDVGAGAGIPSVPCLIARQDLRATLIESKEKKTKFLRSAIGELGLSDRAKIVNRQFEETSPGDADFVTCRALDKFTEKVPRLIKWSGSRRLLFFGGPALGAEMRKRGVRVREKLMPLSNQRFLFVSR